MKTFAAILLAATFAFAADVKLGKPLTLTESIGVDKLMTKPDDYVGKTVQVKGTVTAVCEAMGCWMEIADAKSGKAVKIQVEHGDIVFPKSAIGKVAVAEGKLSKEELTKDEAVARAKHEAEERKQKFDPSKVKGGITSYQIDGTGVVVLE